MIGPEVPGVVTPSAMPEAIVEALFISNDGDAAVLTSPEGEQAIVTAYENAMVDFLSAIPGATLQRDTLGYSSLKSAKTNTVASAVVAQR
jgi:hypothetical protein